MTYRLLACSFLSECPALITSYSQDHSKGKMKAVWMIESKEQNATLHMKCVYEFLLSRCLGVC